MHGVVLPVQAGCWQAEWLDPVTDCPREGTLRKLEGKRIRLRCVRLLSFLLGDTAAQAASLESSGDLGNTLVVDALVNEFLEGRAVVFLVPPGLAWPCPFERVVIVEPIEFLVSVDRFPLAV